MLKTIRPILVLNSGKRFSSSALKIDPYSKPRSISKTDLEIRKPLPSDIVDITQSCLDIWEGTCPHPDNFLKLLKSKNALHKVVVHKPTKKVIASIMSTLFRAPPLPSNELAEPPNADYSSQPYPPSKKVVSEEELYEISPNAGYTHPDFRADHVTPYCAKEMAKQDLNDLKKLPIRYIYTSFYDLFTLGTPNMGPHGGPEINCFAASNYLIYECSFKDLDKLTALAQKLISSGMLPDYQSIEPISSRATPLAKQNQLESLITASQQLETMRFEDVYDNLRDSPYLTQLLMSGRYWSTEMAPLAFHPANFVKDLNPYDASILVGRDSPNNTTSSCSNSIVRPNKLAPTPINPKNAALAPVSSISSTCTFWMPAGVCISQFSSALTVEQTILHIVRTLSESRERLEQAHRSRPLETYPSSFYSAKEISGLPKWLVVSPDQKLDKFILILFFNLKCSRNKVDQTLRSLLNMQPKTMIEGQEFKRLYFVRFTCSHPLYPS